jgi:hypothetical protein
MAYNWPDCKLHKLHANFPYMCDTASSLPLVYLDILFHTLDT